MAVDVSEDRGFEPGTPRALFLKQFRMYAVSRDRQRFLMNVPAGEPNGTNNPITVVLNWYRLLSK